MNKSELSKYLHDKLWNDCETTLYDYHNYVLKADINLFDAETILYYIEPNGKPHKIESIDEYIEIIENVNVTNKAIINDEIMTILHDNIYNATAEVIDDFATGIMYVGFEYNDWVKLFNLVNKWDEEREYNE